MSSLILLSGLPGSGKSFIRDKIVSQMNPPTVFTISRDQHIENIARKFKLTYREVFADEHFSAMADSAVNSVAEFARRRPDAHVIIDRTNLTRAERARWIDMFSDRTLKIGVNVVEPDMPMWQARLTAMDRQIPRQVIEDMMHKRCEIELDEGFDTLYWSRSDTRIDISPWIIVDVLDEQQIAA